MIRCAVCGKEVPLTPSEALEAGWIKEEEIGIVDWVCPSCEDERKALRRGKKIIESGFIRIRVK